MNPRFPEPRLRAAPTESLGAGVHAGSIRPGRPRHSVRTRSVIPSRRRSVAASSALASPCLAIPASDRRAARRLADALLTHLLERKLRAAR